MSGALNSKFSRRSGFTVWRAQQVGVCCPAEWCKLHQRCFGCLVVDTSAVHPDSGHYWFLDHVSQKNQLCAAKFRDSQWHHGVAECKTCVHAEMFRVEALHKSTLFTFYFSKINYENGEILWLSIWCEIVFEFQAFSRASSIVVCEYYCCRLRNGSKESLAPAHEYIVKINRRCR